MKAWTRVDDNNLSTLAPLLCGVPRGSILGPLLFLIYINDIANCTNKLLFYLFADDTTIFITDDKNQTLFDTMNCELEYLSNWFHVNFLSLNSKKLIILFSLDLETKWLTTQIRVLYWTM